MNGFVGVTGEKKRGNGETGNRRNSEGRKAEKKDRIGEPAIKTADKPENQRKGEADRLEPKAGIGIRGRARGKTGNRRNGEAGREETKTSKQEEAHS